MNKTVFIGPIWAHYRSSLIDELINKNSDSYFYGAKNYLTNKPIKSNRNVRNILKKRSFNFLNHTFYWYRNIFKVINFKEANKIVIVGFDPHMLHVIVLVFYLKFFLRKEFYWWSHASYGNQGRLGRFIRLFFYNKAKGILSYSKEGKNRLITQGVSEERITVLNNCLNYNDYGWLNYNLDEEKKKHSSFRVILTGKLNREKKIHILIDAIQILVEKKEEVFCTIVGDGDLYEELKSSVISKKITKYIKFTGAKYGKDIHDYLLNSDLYIIPGAVGLSIVHGFSFGLPILTSDKKEIHRPEIELLNKGINGDVFLDNDAYSLANKILQWRNKIIDEGKLDYFTYNCIESIKAKRYLPKDVAKNILKKINE